MSDENEWNEAAAKYVKKVNGNMTQPRSPDQLAESTKDEEKVPGKLCQYSLYGAGYAATTATIQKLPPGCYDIYQDNRCAYVVPTLNPNRLLLELPEMRSEQVIKMVDSFWNSEKDYKDGNDFVNGGAQFKSGIMIFGPPGSGKSCTIKLVSKKLVERGGTVFYASNHPNSIMTWLDDFSRVEPNRKCIVILEDIDSLIENYGESRYLEMLDSAKTIDNVLFIGTTNYPEKLDPRIYNRPGRFAHVIKIDMPTAAARKAFLEAILKNHRDVEKIVKETDGFSVDHLSALVNAVYREKKDLDKEIKRLRDLFNVKPRVDSNESPIGIGIGKDN